MAEAKQLAEKVDKQTKVIEEAVEKRAAFKEELVTVILKIKSLPPDTVPVPKPSPSTYLASSSALEQLLECASRSGGPQAKALAEKVDQERKATASMEVPGEPVLATPTQATGQWDRERTPSPGRCSPVVPEQGILAEPRGQDTDQLSAVEETTDEGMEDVSGEQPSPEDGADALAVEEARKRIHATLDAGDDPLSSQNDSEGHEVLERLHLRPAAKASREYPEETPGATDSPQGTAGNSHGKNSKLGNTGCAGVQLTDNNSTHWLGYRPVANVLGNN
eukprot:2971660-Amphidinium_carterae.1